MIDSSVRRAAGLISIFLAALVLPSCISASSGDFDWIGRDRHRARDGSGQLRIAWFERLTPLPEGAFDEGSFHPIERAHPTLDPQGNRIFIGTTAGDLFALDDTGRRVFKHATGQSIEAAPVLSESGAELYMVNSDGDVRRLDASDGEEVWQAETEESIRHAPVLGSDAVYVVGENDRVIALARSDGEILWTYEREAIAGFTIRGHAGLLIDENRVVTGFSDGAVVALDAGDGSVVWERDTTLDLAPPTGGAPRFTDVDTTPVLVDEHIYVASFAGGLYALARTNGSVEFRDAELTTAVGIAYRDRWLAVATVDHGVTLLEAGTHRKIWSRSVERGAPTRPVITENGLVLYAETDGSMLGVTIETGREIARLHSGTGFTSPPVVAGDLGAILSNGGSLYVFRLH